MTPILLFIVLTILSYLGVWIIRRYAKAERDFGFSPRSFEEGIRNEFY